MNVEISFEAAKESIKERADFAGIVSKHTKLIKTAQGFKACCPLPGHKEKSASFHLNTKDNYYYCYGCQRGGDVFKFLEVTEGLSFIEALKELSVQTGIELPKPKKGTSDFSGEDKTERALGFEILERSAKFFARVLQEQKSEGAKRAWKYLTAERGLSEEDIQKFELGWAPEGFQTLTQKIGAPSSQEFQVALKIGLLKKFDQKPAYDFFNQRLMIPIQDHRGRVCGFSGRTLEAVTDKNPKYKNSSESEWFKKKYVLYGLNRVTPLIREKNYVCFVEGYFDQWAFEKRGIPAVAVMGTALGEEQLQVLEKHTTKGVLVLDADKAGVASMERAAPVFLNKGWDLRIFTGLEGKDPDEWLKANKKSSEIVEGEIKNSPEALEWMLQLAFKKAQENRVGRAQALGSLKGVWQLAKTPEQQVALLESASRLTGTSVTELRKAFGPSQGASGQGAAPFARPLVKKTSQAKATVGLELLELLIARWELLQPKMESEWAELDELFASSDEAEVLQALRQGWVQFSQGVDKFPKEFQSLVFRARAASRSAEWAEEVALRAFADFKIMKKNENLKHEMQALEVELRATQTSPERKLEILKQISGLRRDLQNN